VSSSDEGIPRRRRLRLQRAKAIAAASGGCH
jgi:hypothetical protein